MTSFDWSILTAGLAAGFGVALIAMTGLRRRGARRETQLAQVAIGRTRRRIDVVAIDEAAGLSLEQEGDRMTPKQNSQPETLRTETTKERS